MRFLVHNLDNVETEAQDDDQHGDVDDQQVEDGVEVLIDDAQEEYDIDLGDTPELPQVPTRRSNRLRKPYSRYPLDEYVILAGGGELECFEEALDSEEKKQWLDAMQDEMKSLHDNHTYDLVKLPKGKRALETRWIFRVKQYSNSTSKVQGQISGERSQNEKVLILMRFSHQW